MGKIRYGMVELIGEMFQLLNGLTDYKWQKGVSDMVVQLVWFYNRTDIIFLKEIVGVSDVFCFSNQILKFNIFQIEMASPFHCHCILN